MFFILFLLIVPWVGKFYNEYGLELLPRSGGRGACGSLCIRSAELAVEAALGFWYSLCAGLSSVLFSQEVSGVRETWVNLSFPYHRDLQVWKADCLWASFRGQGHRGLRNYAMPLLFFLWPNCEHLLQRGFPVCLVLRDSCFELLYSHTQSFHKESAGPRLKSKDGNAYKRRSQFGAI